MDAVSTSYNVYAQLPELQDENIRLVILRSGQLDEPVDCSLITCSMNDGPAYEALSYAWGHRSRGYLIALNGLPFMVFDNLGQALRQLRDAELDRTFWIDAISINQANLEERSSQVQKMQQIYQNAKEVAIWLGVEADESDQAVDDILALNVDEHITETPFYREFTVDALRTADGRFVDRAYPLRCLFERGWFKRMWALQEIVLAPKASFYCGNRSFSWDCLEKSNNAYHAHVRRCCKQDWKRLDRDATYMWYPIGEFVSLVSRLQRARSRHTLLQLLLLCRSRLAEDRRDKIYALLGLYNSNGMEKIKPDYTLPPREVYLQVARMLIEGSTGLDLLTHVFSSHQTLDLPSWVPDWSEADYNNPNSFFSTPNHLNYYNACGSAEPEFEFVEDALSVRAITIDTISACGSMIRLPDGKGKLRPKGLGILDDFLQWESLAGLRHTETPPYFSGPDSICDAFWRTMTMDVWHDYVDARHRRALPTDYEAYLKWRPWFEERMRPGGDPDGSVYATGVEDPDIYTFDLEILTQNSVRRFFRTENGHIGMGPMEMQKGDHVMVLAGGMQPLVMRPSKTKKADTTPSNSYVSSFLETGDHFAVWENTKPSGEQSSQRFSKANSEGTVREFTLVGFSYLHGFMDGEATVNSEWVKILIR